MRTCSTVSLFCILPWVVAGATSSCIFLVDEAGEGGAGGGGLTAATVTSSTGGGGAATATTSSGGGGAGGGVIPACEASLETLTPASEFPRSPSFAMVLTEPAGEAVDLYLVSNSGNKVEAFSSEALEDPAAAEGVAPFFAGSRLARHPEGGVLAVDGVQAPPDGGYVFHYTHPNLVNPGFLATVGIWNPTGVERMSEAAAWSGNHYGLTTDGVVQRITSLNESEPMDIGGAPVLSRMVGDPGGLVVATPGGAILRCGLDSANPAECAKLRASTLPPLVGSSYTFETLAYDSGRDRYFAFVAVGVERKLYTGQLDVGLPMPDPVELAGAPFKDALAVAMTDHHLLVMTPTQVYPCCLDSLSGSDPCGEPASMLDPATTDAEDGIVAAHGHRVVAQRLGEAPYTMRAFDIVDPAHP